MSQALACGLMLCLLAGFAHGQSAGDLRFSAGNLRFSTSNLSFSAGDLLAPAENTPTEQRFRLSGDVLFDFDKGAIRPEAESMLAGLAKRIRADFPNRPVRVEGHTDTKGSDSYNQDLSVRRADTVKAWFVGEGFSAPIQASGFGESQPVEPNELPDGSDNPVGRQQNRRVEIIVEK